MNKADQIAQVARVFVIGAKRCEEQRQLPNGKIEAPLPVAVVCLAFSVELFLKAILTMQSNHYGKEHNLKILFDKIDRAERDRVIGNTGMKSDVFLPKLEKAAGAFVDWRYLYEQGPMCLDYDFLSRLQVALEGLLTQIMGMDGQKNDKS